MLNAGFNSQARCQSVVSGDFDNDMHEDLFLACTGGSHNMANRLFRNNGNGTFTEIANAGGAAGHIGAAVAEHAGTHESVVVADYDLDGFLDLLVTNGDNMRPLYLGGPKELFHNRGGNGNNWVEFDLVGTTSNRDAIGSKVYVTAGGVTQYREQNGGYHKWSQNFMRVHVGLADQHGGRYHHGGVARRHPDNVHRAGGRPHLSAQAGRDLHSDPLTRGVRRSPAHPERNFANGLRLLGS